MEAIWPAAVARVEEEVADMQALSDREGAGISIEPGDLILWDGTTATEWMDQSVITGTAGQKNIDAALDVIPLLMEDGINAAMKKLHTKD